LAKKEETERIEKEVKKKREELEASRKGYRDYPEQKKTVVSSNPSISS